MISVVVPTISGREESYERCVYSFEKTLDDTDFEIIPVLNKNNWPLACNHGYELSTGDIVVFTADDLEAVSNWWQDAVALLEVADELPAGYVWNHSLFGDPDNIADGSAGQLTWFTRLPMMRRDQWQRIGQWPNLDFYADVWLSERARSIGIETRLVGSYRFVHHWHDVGRISNDSARVDRAYRLLERMRKKDGLQGIELVGKGGKG